MVDDVSVVAFKNESLTDWLLDNPQIVEKTNQGNNKLLIIVAAACYYCCCCVLCRCCC